MLAFWCGGMGYWYCKGFHLIHGCEIPFCVGERHAAIHMPTTNGGICSQCLLLTIVITLSPDKRDTLMAYYVHNNNIIRRQEKNRNLVEWNTRKRSETLLILWFLLHQTWMWGTQFNEMIWTSDPGLRNTANKPSRKSGAYFEIGLFCATYF